MGCNLIFKRELAGSFFVTKRINLYILHDWIYDPIFAYPEILI